MAFCPKCGKEYPDGAKFCTGCGQSLAAAAPVAPVEPPAAPVEAPIPVAPKKKKGKTGLIIAVVIALIAALVGGGIWAVSSGLLDFDKGQQEDKDKEDEDEDKDQDEDRDDEDREDGDDETPAGPRPADPEEEEPGKKPSDEKKSYVFPLVVLDNDVVTYTITGFEEDEDSFSVNVLVENHTDLMLTTCWADAAVNGVVLEPGYSYVDVEPGSVQEGQISIDCEILQTIDAEWIDELGIDLDVYDADTYEDLFYEWVFVYPTDMDPKDVEYHRHDTSRDMQILADEKDLLVSLVDVEENYGTYVLTFYAESYYEDEITVAVTDLQICGYSVDTARYTYLLEGQCAYPQIVLPVYELESWGIYSLDEVVFTVQAQNAWKYGQHLDNRYAIYPTGKTADSVVYPDRIETPDEWVAIDNEDLTLVILSAEDSYGDLRIWIYLENKTGQELEIAWENVVLDGESVDVYLNTVVPAGGRTYENCYIWGSSEISDTLEFTCQIRDGETWDVLDEIYCKYEP